MLGKFIESLKGVETVGIYKDGELSRILVLSRRDELPLTIGKLYENDFYNLDIKLTSFEIQNDKIHCFISV